LAVVLLAFFAGWSAAALAALALLVVGAACSPPALPADWASVPLFAFLEGWSPPPAPLPACLAPPPSSA
jgi:hypothetical protein